MAANELFMHNHSRSAAAHDPFIRQTFIDMLSTLKYLLVSFVWRQLFNRSID
jgi:hypothetical protein